MRSVATKHMLLKLFVTVPAADVVLLVQLLPE